MKLLKALLLLLLLTATFAGGYIVRASKPSTPKTADRRVLYWVDPMHPAYTSDKPGIAPDCGMQLEPVFADGGPSPTATTGQALPGDAPSGAIHISPERQQLIGVKFALVEAGGASRTIRTVGTVAADETRVGHVHTRTDGWIEKVLVDFTGDLVRAGQPMLTVYSPEMLASQQELLLAVRARDLMNANPLASAAQHGESLFEAAKRRLELWDLSDDQIQQVLRSGEPIHSITVRAPMSGFITVRNAFPNQRVTPDSDLYTITDLSHVWIVADIFESDMTAIQIGNRASVLIGNGAATPIAARVTYIQPQVDPTTRTLQVRLDASNPGMRLKPDMFVSVEFGTATTPQLTVPADAILDTGDRQTVFVDRGNGYLEPRQVTAGERFGDRVAVTHGLSAGERVVAAGTFLIDSESQLKAAAAGMGTPSEHTGHAPVGRTLSGPPGAPDKARPTSAREGSRP